MGVCLCKEKVEDGTSGNVDGFPDIYSPRSDIRGTCNRYDHGCTLSETVDRLVKETLEVIGTIVDK